MNRHPYTLLAIGLFVACSAGGNWCVAQRNYTLTVQTATDEPLPDKIRYIRQLPDSLAAIAELQRLLTNLHGQSYLAASVDSLRGNTGSLIAFLHVGAAYRWVKLRQGNVDEEIATGVGFREKLYRTRPFSYRELAALEEKLLRYMDDHGYPFASIRLDSVHIYEKTLQASLNLRRGPFIRFDTLVIVGTAKLKQKFLANYLKMLPGQPFSQQKMTRAARELGQLPYLSITQPFDVRFKNDRAYPVIYADARRTNELDGIIGFLPNEQASGKLLLTGELRLHLQNLFHSGKHLRVQWQQIRPASPRLEAAYVHPALLGTPLELQANFNLLKEDSAFVSIYRRLALAYPLGNGGKIAFHAGLQTSQLNNNAQYQNDAQRPALADSRWLFYGATYAWNNVDNPVYPTRGTDVSLSLTTGNKQISKNPFVESSQYDQIPLTSPQLVVQASVKKYVRLTSRAVLFTGLSGGKVANASLFRNDLFRLGGLTSVRGFNENFFFASDYATATVEYRFSTDATSQLFLFYDQAYVRFAVSGQSFRDTPLGTGLGVRFATKAGICQVVYAVGHSADRPFGFNQSKIHFGVTSRF